MSDKVSEEGGTNSLSDILDDAEACKDLNQEALLTKVRKMNQDLEATCIPLHNVPVALVVEDITREKMAASWYRLCEEGGELSDGRHIRRVVRSTTLKGSPVAAMMVEKFQDPYAKGSMAGEQRQRRALAWQDEYPRSRYRGHLFRPPIYDDEPSDSDDDEPEKSTSGLAAPEPANN